MSVQLVLWCVCSDVFAILDCLGVWTELTIFRFMKLLLSKINSSLWWLCLIIGWTQFSLACGQSEGCWTGFINVGLCARDVACKGPGIPIYYLSEGKITYHFPFSTEFYNTSPVICWVGVEFQHKTGLCDLC